MSRTFFTADPHFGHENIIQSCQRPFPDADFMNEVLIERWNSVVKNNDDVYVLGDVFLKMSHHDAQIIMDSLIGRKHLICGNHEKIATNLKGWESISHYVELRHEGVHLILNHYPFKTWNQAHRGSVNLYGHVHGSLEQYANQIDVGVDCWEFTPRTLYELIVGTEDRPAYVPPDYPSSMRDAIVQAVEKVRSARLQLGEADVEA